MRFALLLCPLCLAGGARGQPVPDPRGEPVPEVLTPPKLIEEVPPEYPAGASGSARVVLQLDVDERGAPGNLLVLSEPQPGFDESALAAARKLRFDPARRGGQPIAVRIQYAFNFAPPAAAQPPRPEELPVNLAGRIRERGTRRKLSGIEISAAGRSASTDREGRFELRGVPEGEPVEIVVAAPGYERFIARETIPPGQKLEVEYRLQALYSSPFEATIEGERERTEISRTTVSKEETERVPGAQGDSLKVVEDLPGVARTSPIGGGALVIRGSKPGDSVVYLDGEPIPLLYHFAALSSTFNPDLLEAIDFVPGNFSSRYGDLTGGLVEVRTRKLREEPHGYANLNLLEASALIEGAIPEVPGLSVALAGRRSYIDYILRAALSANTDFSLTVAPRYYDAQLRVDWRPPDNPHSFSLLALTSDDALGFVLNRPTEQDPNLSGSIDAETGFQQIRLKRDRASSGRGRATADRLHGAGGLAAAGRLPDAHAPLQCEGTRRRQSGSDRSDDRRRRHDLAEGSGPPGARSCGTGRSAEGVQLLRHRGERLLAPLDEPHLYRPARPRLGRMDGARPGAGRSRAALGRRARRTGRDGVGGAIPAIAVTAGRAPLTCVHR
ncbi:MAG: hypothetical protein AUI90_00150 [Deltaproteobacteria bacterium 13_1_40CM_3_69_14]|nr:MAG: hypothetical protein AUI90_00150 [Deltaproteobacteria bacterium 13_1_40CM_3_69_14]